ncbi:hypothetical protein PATA110616_15165 [Paenibacillus tarimensis]
MYPRNEFKLMGCEECHEMKRICHFGIKAGFAQRVPAGSLRNGGMHPTVTMKVREKRAMASFHWGAALI